MTKRVDPKWQEVQEETLVNWANAALRGPISTTDENVLQIRNLKEDIKDGSILLELLDNVSTNLGSGKLVKRRYKKPQLQVQMRENIVECFKFIERENIKLVNIGVIDVLEGNVKLMLGLIWTLIRRYQIKSSGKAVSTKQAMLLWLETLIPEKAITNFSTNWNDGTALCTLVDRIQPGLCSNHSTLNSNNGMENCTLGMNLARDKLSVPQILKPEHLNNPKVDEMSVMTYISYFCKPAMSDLLAWVQSRIPHQNITNFNKDWSTGVNLAALLDTVSPGLLPNWNQLDPHEAISNLEIAMKAAEQLGVQRVLKPEDFAAPDVDEINIVTYLSRIRKSKPMSLAQKCTVTGQGVVKAFVGREAFFEVDASHAGIGGLSVTATSSSGNKLAVNVLEKRKDVFGVSYTATEKGSVTISIKWGNKELTDSPFKPSVVDPGTFKFYGPEITEGMLCKIGKPITMYADGIGDIAELEVKVNGSAALNMEWIGDHKGRCSYAPSKAGKEQVVVKLSGKPIPQSPFEIQVVDPNSCRVIATDSDPACIGKPFTVTVSAEKASIIGISAKATSPSQQSIQLTTDSYDDKSIVRYTPKEIGSHAIVISCIDDAVQGSPVTLEVIDTMKAIFKDSIPKFVHLGKPVTINIETANCGNAILQTTMSNANLQVLVNEKSNGLYSLTLNPLSLGESEFNVTLGGYSLPGFPATVKACDASVCSAYGKALASRQGMVEELFEFTVQAANAGDGELEVIPSGPNSRYAADIDNLGNGKFDVSFTSYEPGLHSIEILWGGKPIPDSPVAVKFVKTASGQFTATGEGLSKCVAKQTTQFMILGRESGLVEDGILEVFIEGSMVTSKIVQSISPVMVDPNVLVCIDDMDNGKYQVQYCVPGSGDYNISIMCSGEHITGSPFNTYALPAPEPEKCHVFGPAIDEPSNLVVGKPIEFRVDSTDAGTGKLEIVAFDPLMTTVPVYLGEQKGKLNERIHIVKVEPQYKGKHTFEVRWGNEHIPTSPIRFEVGDPKMVKIVSIPDKESFIPKVGESFDVVLDDTTAGPGVTTAKVKLPNGSIKDLQCDIVKHKYKKFTFTPTEVGRIELLLAYSGVNILEFPWYADVINTKSFEVISSMIYAKQGEYVKFVVAGMKKSNAKNMVLKAVNGDHDATVKTDMKKDGTAIARFTAKKLGKYDVSIMCAKQHVSGSPFSVYIVNPDNAVFNSTLPSTLVLGQSYTIKIDGSSCGPGELQYALIQGNEDVPACINCTLDSVSEGVYTVTVHTLSIGKCKLGFQWEDFPINEMQELSIADISKCVVSCPQLENRNSLKQNRPITVYIDVSECGECVPEVIAKGPQAKYETTAESGDSKGQYNVKFSPWQTGNHTIHVKIGGSNAPSTPLKFIVLKDIKPDQIIASGDGLKEAYTGLKSIITIHGLETGLLERGQLTYNLDNIIGDFSAPPECSCVDNGNGLYTLSYVTHDDGDHCLEIMYEGQDIASSPFKISVKPQARSDLCIASGSILQPGSYLNVKEQAEIVVDSRKAGSGVLKVTGRQPDGSPIRVFVNYEEKDKLHYLMFNGSKVGAYVISVEWDETPIPGSPFTVNVVDPSRCFLSGDIPSSIQIGVVKSITVDATVAGSGTLDVLFDGTTSSPFVTCTVNEKLPAQYELEFEGCEVGETEVSVCWGGHNVQKSPSIVSICDASQCILEADNVRDKSLQAGYPFQFTVKSNGAGKCKPVVHPSVQSSAQYIIDVSTNNEGNEHTVSCTPQTIGEQQLDIFWADQEIQGSPLSFSVFNPNKCKVIELPDSSTFTPVVGEDILFSVDVAGAGPGEAKAIGRFSDGAEEEIPFDKNETIVDFKCSPHTPGRFELVLLFNNVPILKTPWVSDVPDPLQFRVTRPKGTGRVYEPVKFFITGVTEQKQNFKVTAVHPEHPAIVSIETGKEGSTAVATFTPEAVGEYLVHAKHALQDIEGSPFVIDVVNPNAVDIFEPPPEHVIINKQYVIRLKAVNAGNGPLTCHIASITGDIAFASSESEGAGTDVKEVRFIGDNVGTGQLTLRWGDHVISPSPYTVQFIDPSKVTVTCAAFENSDPINLGEPTEVVINCREAGNGNLDVKVNNRSSEVDSTAISIQDKKDGTFVAAITPWKAGEHELIVTYSTYPAPEIPMVFEVQKMIDSRGITVSGEGLTSAIVEEPTILTINASVPGLVNDGLLKASCVLVKGEETESPDGIMSEDVEMEFADMNDGTYNLTVVYHKVGKYVLNIDYKEEPVYKSPFNVSVELAANAENCKLFGTAIDKLRSGQAFLVSQSIQFMIDTTSAGNGYLMCTVQDPSGDPVRVFSNDEETDGKCTSYLQFDPYEVGQYTVQVYWSSEAIPGMPLVFNIVDPTRCLVQGLPLPNNGAVQIGEEIDFAIAPGNCGIEKPKVFMKAKTDDSTEVDLPFEVSETGVYRYKHVNEVSGNFGINVTVGGCHIPGSPFRCEVLDPNQFAIFGLNLKSKYAIVCELVSFKIQGKPPEGESFVVTAHGPLADLSCDITNISDNLTESSFVPIEPGSYEVFVECANKHVPGSPFTVNVADPSKCQLMEVPSQLQVDMKHEVIIKTRGAGVGELDAVVEDVDDQVSIAITDQGLDTYCVSIEPHKVADVKLQITWAGYQIPQSPLRLSICNANQCKVYGQAILSKKGKVGEVISFTVLSNKAGNSKPVIKASGPSAQYNITPREVGENKHEAQFTPWEIGEHSVEILWGNTKIPNSPFMIDVEKNIGGVPTCHATGEGLKKAISGKQAKFTLVSNEVGLLEKESLKVSVAGVRGHAEVELTDMNDGCYQVKYLPPNPGAYIATVTYYDKQIPGSPFKISCVPGPDASKCRVEGLHPNSLFLTGNPIEFTVNSSEAGYGQLKVFIQGPKDYQPKVYVADDGKGLHSVKFDAMEQGRYFIVVAWSEKHVPGSPFKIKVHPAPDASKVVATGPGLLNGKMTGDTNFSIDTKEAGIGTLLIRVHGIKDSFKIEANPLKADDPRILIANYYPKMVGDYTVFIRWSGVHVPGSPFTIHIAGENEETEVEIDARKMIRAARKRESMEGGMRRRSQRTSREEGEIGRHLRRSSSKDRTGEVVEKPRRVSKERQVMVVRTTEKSRRISREEMAAMARTSVSQSDQQQQQQKGASLFGLFKSSKKTGMSRTRSGSELPSVSPVKPKLKMRKNPSMGQMPLFMPQTVSPIDQPMLMDKNEAKRRQKKGKERKKSKSAQKDPIIEEADAPLEKPQEVKEKPKKRKKSRFELS